MLSQTDPIPQRACPAPFNLAHQVLGRADVRADQIALEILRPAGAERWDYGRLEAAMRGVASGFLALGLQPGTRILLRLGNDIGFPLAFLGAIAAGLVPVPTAASLTAVEAGRLCAAVAPGLIVAGDGIALPDSPPCLVLPEADLRGFEALPPASYVMGDPDRLAYIVFTSGTSGTARAVAHGHRTVWARHMMREGWTGITAGDRLLHAGALNWTYTLGTGLFDPWLVGATALVPADGTDILHLPQLARRYDATIFAAVPGVYRRILRNNPQLELPRLRHGLSAGEKLPVGVRRAWRDATGTDLHEAMGLSECSTFLSSCPARPAPDDATGYAQPGRHMAVLGTDGRPVERGELGRLAINRTDPGLFLGYVDGETIQAPTGDWFETGDLVAMDSDGAITSHGRADDMITAGGFRISPEEIEAVLNTHPAVEASAAVELALHADTTVIAAFYQGAASEAALRHHLKDRLAPYKQPRVYHRLDHVPVTANGKVNRRTLREEWKETT